MNNNRVKTLNAICILKNAQDEYIIVAYMYVDVHVHKTEVVYA